jgi:uncharacterized protein YodC (DUF2158 family)
MATFKVGDVVVLNSGGPRMVVRDLVSADYRSRSGVPLPGEGFERIGVNWMNVATLEKALLPTACVRLATSEDK